MVDLLDQFEFVILVTRRHGGSVAVDRIQLVPAVSIRCFALQPRVLAECSELELGPNVLVIVAPYARPHLTMRGAGGADTLMRTMLL